MSLSASRPFTLLGASIFRNRLRRHHTIPVIFFYPKPLTITSINLISSSPLSSLRYSSFATAVLEPRSSTTTTTITGNDDVETSSLISIDHPWPEWVAFVDCLKRKGYFTRNSSTLDAAASGGGDDDEAVMNDLNSLKFACLGFARDRSDIFKSLSKEEILAVVDKGCPNLFRKAVTAGKRLRAYLKLNEADVCNVCVLRGSCDRAFYVLKDFEATARTVDIVRVLMLYALDSIVNPMGVKTPAREAIEVSARKLLTELIELSETERDPHLIDSDVEVLHQKAQATPKNTGNAEMKRGDWMCSQCNFLNFTRNLQCRKCGEDGPRRVGGNDIEMKKGDWLCPECNFMNFAKNRKCLQCKAEGPKNISYGERKGGDWDCASCGFMNFATNIKCKRCQDLRTEGRPGEWACPKCRFWNYANNTSCKKCDIIRPNQSKPSYKLKTKKPDSLNLHASIQSKAIL